MNLGKQTNSDVQVKDLNSDNGVEILITKLKSFFTKKLNLSSIPCLQKLNCLRDLKTLIYQRFYQRV